MVGVEVHVKKDVLEEIWVADEVGKLTYNVVELDDFGPLKWGTGLCVDDVVRDGWDVVDRMEHPQVCKFTEVLQVPI